MKNNVKLISQINKLNNQIKILKNNEKTENISYKNYH